MGGLPTIIGTTDLVPFDGETTTLTQEWHREVSCIELDMTVLLECFTIAYGI